MKGEAVPVGEMQECYRSGEKIEYPEQMFSEGSAGSRRKSAAGSLQGWPAERF